MPRQERNDLLARLVEAIGTGETNGVVDLLAKHVMLHSDGGGKAITVPNELHKATDVARGTLGTLKLAPKKPSSQKLAHINGEPDLLNYLDGGRRTPCSPSTPLVTDSGNLLRY